MPDPLITQSSTGVVLVCGSRGWNDQWTINTRLLKLPPDTTVIHGAARGADRMAGELAEMLGMTVREYPADWAKNGKSAGIIRNMQMLDEYPDLVLAFRSPGRSRGTDHTITEAHKRGIPVEVITA